MKRLILALAIGAGLVYAATAIASSVVVTDPTNSAFTGSYSYSCTDANGNPTTCQGTQEGYVRVSTDASSGPEVQACNGNASYTRPDTGGALQGYIYLSPSGSGPANPDAGGNQYAGANNNQTQDPSAAPCSNNPSSSGVNP